MPYVLIIHAGKYTPLPMGCYGTMTFPHPPGSTPQRLCARLDAVDFRLTAALASGRPWASLEVAVYSPGRVSNVVGVHPCKHGDPGG